MRRIYDNDICVKYLLEVYGVAQSLHLLGADEVTQLAGGASDCWTPRHFVPLILILAKFLGQNALPDEGAVQRWHVPHVVGYHKHPYHRAYGIQ